MFSIEKSLSQQIRVSLRKTNNLFTQLYLKYVWETTVSNQNLLKRPIAFVYYLKKRKQLLKKSKRINKVFFFSIKTIICAAHERWPLNVNPDYIYKSLLMSGKRLSKEEFYRVLREKEENYQRASTLFFEGLKTHFFYLVPYKRERSNPKLRKIFFDAILHVLQDPKIQKIAIKSSTRRSKSHLLAARKMKDIKEMLYEESEVSSFDNAA
ncbi:MAG: hypothetical protein C5B45_03670 [Chlamydiae bacterium]|nr:MAG: hypothetical protein C5B45_03670 [Chlamydiota bacterium]